VRARSEIAPGFLVPSFLTLSVLPPFPPFPALPVLPPFPVCDERTLVLDSFTEMRSILGLRALELSILAVTCLGRSVL